MVVNSYQLQHGVTELNTNIQSGVSHTEAENLIFPYLFQIFCENNLLELLLWVVGNCFLPGFFEHNTFIVFLFCGKIIF
jgi:hypothetical protein